MKKFTLIGMALCAGVLAAMLVSLTPGPVQAGGPPACDALGSDCVTVTFPTGAPISFGFPEGPGEPPGLVLLLGGIPGGPVAIVFTEPGSTDISDILLLINNTLFFESDTDGGAPLVAPGGIPLVFLEETGGVQDVSGLLGLSTAGITVTVQSDVETVPEPSTLLLLGSGLAGLAYWRRRKAS